MAPRLEVVANEKAAARRAAELIAVAGAAAAAERGPFGMAMSGGRSPWAMLAILGELEQMPWGSTELFQVDERIASPGSEDRNLTHMVLGLSMDHQSALRPMPVTQRDLDAGALRPRPPRSRPRRPHRLAGPGRPGPRGGRPPRRPHRRRVPGPPAHDPHLSRDRRCPPDPLAGHRRREARAAGQAPRRRPLDPGGAG